VREGLAKIKEAEEFFVLFVFSVDKREKESNQSRFGRMMP
jgi:hypothetical protein